VNVAGDSIDRIGGHVRALGVMVFLGLLAAGLTVGGLVVLASGAMPVLGWAALGSAIVLSAAAAAFHAASVRMKKISVRQLLQR
jgi:ubiquinone biosynthesis protein